MNKVGKIGIFLVSLSMLFIFAGTRAYLKDVSTNSADVFTLADIAPPVITEFSVNKTANSFTLNLVAQDSNVGINKIRWYYKGCTSESYEELPETTFASTTDEINESRESNTCLDFCTYYAYAEVYDSNDNKIKSEVIEFTLDSPSATEVSYDNKNSGTKCTTVDCALNELYDIYSE